MIDMLQGYHYSDRSFNDLKAAELIDSFLDRLDRDRNTLTAADVEYFHRRFDRNLKSVYLFRGDVQPAYEIFDRLVERILSRGEWIRRRLERGIEFEEGPAEGAAPATAPVVPSAGAAPVAASSSGDAPAVAPATAATAAAAAKGSRPEPREPWAADEKALDERWEQRLRRDVLGELLRGRTLEQAQAWVRDHYAGSLKQLRAWDAQHVREVFLNSMLESFDAHSGYFSKESAESFTTSITGSSQGVGISFELHEGHLHVESLVAGGPADRDGRIVPGERLLSLQEEGGERLELGGLPPREALRKLEGKEGSRVILGFGDEGGRLLREVELERSRHERTEGHAAGVLVQVPSEGGLRKVGLISVPAFYHNPKAEGGSSSTSSDVRELVEKLVAQGAEGIVMDLRNNGGGVMNEALKTVGLFISKGPVFLSRGLDRKVTTMSDEDESLCYGGPLVVLVSGNSASASEAFSGALQWYRRALVVGSPQTFGKGSAQDYIDLRTLANGSLNSHQDGWGVLRLTRQLFYYPDGRSPQLLGVKSDIAFPDYWRDTPHGTEKDKPKALPNETIAAGSPAPAGNGSPVFLRSAFMGTLSALSSERQRTLREFSLAARSTELHSREDHMGDVPLRPASWQAVHAEREAQRIAVAAEWNRLLESEGFAHERVELASIERVRQRHQEALRRAAAGGQARVGRTVGGIHYLETSPGGRILDVPLRHIDLHARRADAALLAETWSAACGLPLSPAAVERFLVRLGLALAEKGQEPDLHTVMGPELPAGADRASIEQGLNALVDRMVRLDSDLCSGRFFMDVRRREALRIAADWARLASSSSSPSP